MVFPRHALSALTLLLMLGCSTSCTRAIPPIPPSARQQPTQSGIVGAWRLQGRVHFSAFGKNISTRVLVVRRENVLQGILLDDSGIALGRFHSTYDETQPHNLQWIHQPAQKDMHLLTFHCAWLLLQSYHPRQVDSTWYRQHRRAFVDTNKRTELRFGGDPVCLRAVYDKHRDPQTPIGWPIFLSNFSTPSQQQSLPSAAILIPHTIEAHGPMGILLRFSLERIEFLETTEVSPSTTMLPIIRPVIFPIESQATA